jgi:hypothetical protein
LARPAEDVSLMVDEGDVPSLQQGNVRLAAATSI